MTTDQGSDVQGVNAYVSTVLKWLFTLAANLLLLLAATLLLFAWQANRRETQTRLAAAPLQDVLFRLGMLNSCGR
ncbi:MAG: hypothetical protein DYG89_36730 [Caldilinea sp. CFX5]|nr:hypothetical protein [Caldilinea sp. CFX5]